jgi:hypothetical protein
VEEEEEVEEKWPCRCALVELSAGCRSIGR